MMNKERLKNQLHELTEALISVTEISYPNLGIDIDGCIDESPIFFQFLSHCWKGKVTIITFRDDREKAIRDLAKFNIRYDELILVDSFEAKAEIVARENIQIYFDDQPEMIKNMPDKVNVMLVRNGGNFCFDDKLWLMSKKTGRMI
jgi:uncharacterized HAD superfamily protein